MQNHLKGLVFFQDFLNPEKPPDFGIRRRFHFIDIRLGNSNSSATIIALRDQRMMSPQTLSPWRTTGPSGSLK